MGTAIVHIGLGILLIIQDCAALAHLFARSHFVDRYHKLNILRSFVSHFVCLLDLSLGTKYPSLTMSDFVSSQKRKLVPSQATQFPGSFAPDLRGDNRKYSESRTWRTVVHTYFTDGWGDINIWKSAVRLGPHKVSTPDHISRYLQFQFIEFVGETSICYLSAMVDTVIGSFHTQQAAAYAGITNIFLISLFIFAMAPSSGGHVNPTITFSTMTAGLTGFSRGVLYLIAQTAGAALAGGLIRGSLGNKLTKVYF